MKKLWITCCVAASLFVLQNMSGQGFVNLDFNSAQLSAYGNGPVFVPASDAIPGWTGYLGTDQQSTILYNGTSLWYGNLSIIASNSLVGDPPPIPGYNYTVVLQAGPDRITSPPAYVNASIAQTGLIPPTAQSILFSATDFSALQVTIAGQVIPFIEIGSIDGYPRFGGNISAFAGQVAELEFTDLTGGTEQTSAAVELDGISFSSSPIAEPASLSLFGICIPFLYWWMARPNNSPEHPPTTPVCPLSRFTSQIRRCSGHGR